MKSVRLRAPLVATPEARARERYRLALWATLTSVGSRGFGMLLLLLGVRLTVGYLGSARFGIWATFASMVAMLSLLDLGVGNALVNRVALAAADNRPDEQRRVISGGAMLLVLLGFASAAVLAALAAVLPWEHFFKLSDPTIAREARQAGVVFAVLFGVNLAGSGMLRVLAGQQRSFEANLLSACATAIACLALWLAASAQANVALLLAATFGVQSLAGLGAGCLLIWRNQIVICNAASALKIERKHLLSTGGLFVLLQLGTMVGWGSDSVLLALMRGSSEVATYAVVLRLFQFASQPFAMINAPLWAAYADACARGDKEFVRLTFKRSFLISSGGGALLCVSLWLTGPWLVSLWTRGTIVVAPEIFAYFAVWTILDLTGNAFGVYLNGCGIVREQVVVVVLFCALVLPLKLWFGSRFGIPGLLGGAIGTYLVVIVGLYGFVFRTRVLAPLRNFA